VKNKLSLKQIEEAIKNAEPRDQKRLLDSLPRLLKISRSDMNLLKVAEKSFGFWNNQSDKVYDKL